MKTLFIYFTGIQLIFGCMPVNAQNWAKLGNGIDSNGGVYYIYADTTDNSLLIGCNKTQVDSITVCSFIRWDGNNWDFSMSNPWGWGFYGTMCITKYNNEIYIGGAGYANSALRKWTGTGWQHIYTGSSSGVECLTNINNELYVGGAFDSIGNIATKNLAKWNGITWSSFSNPISNNYIIYTICEYKNELYVGGNFYNYPPLTDTMCNIMRYDGSNWKSVGGGMHGGMDDINSMVVYNNELYVAGSFTKADGNVGDQIQKWDGTNWSEVGNGVNDNVWQLKVHNGKLYAVGVFSYAGSVPAQHIALWDGTNWCGLGSSIDNAIGAIAFLNDTMYIGGNFWTIDGDSISDMAKWTGGNYVDTCGNETGVSEVINEENNINVFPNPTNGAFTISYGTLQPSICIYNSLGKLVYQKEKAAQKSEVINLSAYSKGIYFIKVQYGEKSYSKKVILE